MLTLVVCVASACAGRSVHTVPRTPVVASYELPTVVEELPAPITVNASGSNDYYATSPGREAGDPLFAAIHVALPAVDLVQDARLDEVALDLTRLPAAMPMSKGLLGFELASHGIAEPAIGVASGADGDATAVVASLLPRLTELTAYGWIALGVAHANGRAVVVVAHRQRFVGERVPRSAATMGRFEIAGVLVDGYRDPTLTVAPDTRTPYRVAFAQRGDRYETSVTCVLAKILWLTITARDRLGDEPIVASFPIGCGGAMPSTYTTEAPDVFVTTDGPRRLAALINRNRVTAGLAPLGRDVRADRAAAAWALDMRRAERVAHAIGSATSVSRLRDNGLVPARSSHLAFHVDSLQEAIELLENDDAYRATLVDREMTHLGLAVVPDPHGGYYTSLELVQIPPRIAVSVERQRLYERAVAAIAKHATVWHSKSLGALAQWYADELALGWSPEMLDPRLGAKARIWRAPQFRAVVRTPTRIDELDIESVIPPRGVHSVGVGVTQSPVNSAFANRILVVVLLGE